MTNLKLMQEHIHLIENVKLFTEVNKQILKQKSLFGDCVEKLTNLHECTESFSSQGIISKKHGTMIVYVHGLKSCC